MNSGSVTSNYTVDYAKSARSRCKGCGKWIHAETVRFGKLIQSRYRDGKDTHWHHPKCFVKEFSTVSYTLVSNFETLRWEDQEELRKLMEEANSKPKRKGGVKRRSLKESTDNPKRPRYDEETLPSLMVHTQTFYSMRDLLQAHFAADKKSLQRMLLFNDQICPSGTDVVDMLADIMAFGSLNPCDECGGQLVYKSGTGGYECTGDLSPYTKCRKVYEDPGRAPFQVPEELKLHDAFKNMNFEARKRVLPKKLEPTPPFPPPMIEVKMDSGETVSIPKADLPLHNMSFLLIGSFSKEEFSEIKEVLQRFGGNVKTRSKTATFIICKPEEYSEKDPKLGPYVKTRWVPIISRTFTQELRFSEDFEVVSSLAKHLLSHTGQPSYIRSHLERCVSWRKYRTQQPLNQCISVPSESLLNPEETLGSVDWRSGLYDNGSVFQENNLYYDATLIKFDISSGTNSYYKMQVIVMSGTDQFCFFRAWGRIGMSYGSTKLDENLSRFDAVKQFLETFEEKTGNKWGELFEKKSGGYELVSHSKLGAKRSLAKSLLALASGPKKSTLPIPVQELVATIFSRKEMERGIIRLKIDLHKFPLLSDKAVLTEAYKILNEAQASILKLPSAKGRSRTAISKKIKDLTNRFYSKVPHTFNALEKPALLDNLEIIKDKIETVNDLYEILFAFDMLRKKAEETVAEYSDPAVLEKCFNSLASSIIPLEKGNGEYKEIVQYFTDSQSQIHRVALTLREVFAVTRSGEKERFEPFQNYPNRRLLWHGSKICNIASILANGLSTHPPGMNFNRGIYFADVVTKSSLYCNVNSKDEFGVLLLCEVALGQMKESTLPSSCEDLGDFNSIKVLGTHEPTGLKIWDDGIQVPLGPVQLVQQEANNDIRLEHNEYIVYDQRQVKIRYLLTFRV